MHQATGKKLHDEGQLYGTIYTIQLCIAVPIVRISLVLNLLGLFHFIVISYHLIFTSFTHALFSCIRFYKCLRISLSLICSTFVSTLNQRHSIRKFIHLISYHFIFQFIHLISFIFLLE